MIKNLVYLAVIVTLVVFGVQYWSPSDAPIDGVTPEDKASAIADRVESTYEKVIVHSTVSAVSESSNSAVVQYVIVLNADPEIMNIQPATQAEADEQALVFGSIQGSLADLLRLSREYIVPQNPTVVQVKITVVLLDGQILDGQVDALDLASLPLTSTNEEWLSVLALSPVVMIPQTIWEIISLVPGVDEAVKEALGQ